MNPAAGNRERVQETVLPLQRLDVFRHPTQYDYELAKDKALQLLRQILPEKAWWELEDKGVLQIAGKRGNYVIRPCSQTEIQDLKSGRIMAYACLQLSVPAPTYDRMVAEYLLIKNAEDVYWKTANIFERGGNKFGMAILFLLAFNLALFINVLTEILLK